MHIADETFSVVILSPLTTIPLQAMQRLREFAQHGGRLIALGRLPAHSTEQRDDPRLKQLLDDLLENENFQFVPARESEWTPLLHDALAAHSPDLSITASFACECIYQHRQIDDAHLYLVANLSEQEGEALISLRAQGAVERWSVETAEMESLTSAQMAEGRTEVACYFAPNELVCLVVTAERASSARAARQSPLVVVSDLAAIELTHWRLEAESPNCLLLEPWRVRGGDQVRELPTSRYDSLEALARASKQQAAAQGLDPSEWTFFMRVARDSNMQAQSSLWPPEGAAYERVARVQVEHIPADVTLVYEDLGKAVSIAINGRPYAGTVGACFVWDRANRQVAVREYLHQGENTIALRTHMPSYRSLSPGAHGMEPVILRGHFGVRDGVLVAPREETDALRSWAELGWPHYSGALTYHTTFRLPAHASGHEWWLVCDEVRETMEVMVNGQPMGVRLWPPYRLNISSGVRAGENQLAITVTNTLANLLTRPLPSGLIGHVQIQCAEGFDFAPGRRR